MLFVLDAADVGKYSPDSYAPFGAYDDPEEVGATDVRRVLCDARLRGVCRGTDMFSVVCMFLAGL